MQYTVQHVKCEVERNERESSESYDLIDYWISHVIPKKEPKCTRWRGTWDEYKYLCDWMTFPRWIRNGKNTKYEKKKIVMAMLNRKFNLSSHRNEIAMKKHSFHWNGNSQMYAFPRRHFWIEHPKNIRLNFCSYMMNLRSGFSFPTNNFHEKGNNASEPLAVFVFMILKQFAYWTSDL